MIDFIFLLTDADKNVVVIYTDEIIAKKMKATVEAKVGKELTIEKRSVNIDVKMIGLVK